MRYSSTAVVRDATLRPVRPRERAPIAPIGELEHRRSDELVHRGLATRNLRRFAPGLVVSHDEVERVTDALRELAAVQFVENKFLFEAQTKVAGHAAEAPSDAGAFLAWLDTLRFSGPGQLDPIVDWLATSANEPALRWYVQQELAAEIGLKLLVHAVGSKVDAPRLCDMATLMSVELPATTDRICWESLARSNLTIALASNRRWANQAIGAFVGVSMTNAQRAATVERALTRLGFEVYPPASAYEPATTETLVRHALQRDPEAAHAIAEGALMWLQFRVRCQRRYSAHLIAR